MLRFSQKSIQEVPILIKKIDLILIKEDLFAIKYIEISCFKIALKYNLEF